MQTRQLFFLGSSLALMFHMTDLHAQGGGEEARDTTVKKVGTTVVVTAPRAPLVQPMPDVLGTAIFTAMKSERIDVPRVDANLASNNTRQLFARSPGIHLWEFDGSGIQANIAARGLSAHRSSEFNVRMNGYDIASDPYGYPEVHFTPPFESLQRVELVRGAASLQFGSQFGGLLNYVTKAPPADRPVALESSQSGGSNGLYSTYTSVGGTIDSLGYMGWVNYRRSDGWRESSGYWFLTGHAQLSYALPGNGRIGVEVTAMDFKQHMPNGLTEAQYAENPRAAYRPRDWFGAPRIMPAITYQQNISDRTRLSVIVAGLAGERNSTTLVSSTAIADTGTNRRRVNRDIFGDISAEPRLLTRFDLFGAPATLATGLRFARTSTDRSQGLGVGGTDFDLDYAGPKTLDLDFVSYNYAAFAQLRLDISDAFAITPGFRIEHLGTGATGTYSREKPATSLFAFDTLGPMTTIDRTLQETFPLFGLGVSATLSPSMQLYGNIAQAYRPLLYAQQFPYDQIPVDTAIGSSKGYSADLGIRGAISWASFDVNGFLIRYDNRVGVIFPDSIRYPIGFRTNAGASRHYGFEGTGEIDLYRALAGSPDDPGPLSILLFTSVGYTNAVYTDGPASGHEVENSPDWIERIGLTFRAGRWLSATLQDSYVGAAFSDAANTLFRADGQQGIIPAYSIADFSFEARVTEFLRLEGSVNNIADTRYFTSRATAYPGPGILPGDGRSFTAGVRVML